MTEKRSSSVLFNKNASPFFPAGFVPLLPYPPSFPYYGPVPQLLSNAGAPPLDVELTNLPDSATQQQLETFLAAELPGWGFSVVHHSPGFAVVQFASPSAAHSAAGSLNLRKWLDSEILATVSNANTALLLSQALSGASSDELVSSSSTLAPFIPAQASGPSNPYYYMPPPYVYPQNLDYGYYGPNAPIPYSPYGFYGSSPINTRTSPRRNSARSISRKNSVNGTYKPPPPFLLNMVKRPESVSGESTPQEGHGEFNADQGLISIEDEDGNPIKVNPRRLFVGNIPFNSTWPALKNFLITKAEEIEPGNSIEILRVEIPMQQPREVGSDISKLNSYQFLTSLSQPLQDTSESPAPEISRSNSVPGLSPTRGLSRGFAIVTTASKHSLEKIIKYFDNVDFEGRTLTVRYDRFPDFNNYVLQQLYPSNKNGHGNKPAFLSNLAFERNSFQQNFYYGHAPMAPFNYQRAPFGARPKSSHEVTMDELAGPLDEIERGIPGESESTQTVPLSDEEKARELVNSFVARDLSA